MTGTKPVADRAALALPGALVAAATIWCSFRAGGFFPGTPAVLAVTACLALLLWVTLVSRPLAGLTPCLLLAVSALALFAAWQLISSTWSDAPGRATIEADRTLLYVLVLLLGGLGVRREARLRWFVRGLVLAGVVVALAALASRLVPDVVTTGTSFAAERLSYPLTYWNSLGLLMALASVLALHLSADLSEPRGARVFGAAALPALATAALLTLSRGAMTAGLVGLVAYIGLARPRGLLPALLAGVIPAGVTVVGAYGATALTSRSFAEPLGLREGHHLAVVLLAVIGIATLLRLVLCSQLDPRLARFEMSPRRRRLLGLGGAGAGVLVVAALVAAGAPGKLGDRAREFVERPRVHAAADARDRLTDPSGNGRIDHWRVALQSFAHEPFHGTGAGTFEAEWARQRPNAVNVRDAHSLPLEVLGELGWPGLLLLLVCLGCIVASHWRRRREARALHSALIAAMLTWGLHAAVDWDWEVPAVTLWLFGAGGLVLAAGPGAEGLRAFAPPRLARVIAGMACLLLALLPLMVARSQAPLTQAIAALDSRDCPRAVDRALASLTALGTRPDPYEVLGYCDARLGRPGLGVQMMRSAVRADPRWWEPYYGLSLLEAVSGHDPRPAARAAYALNPRSPLTQILRRAMTSTSQPAQWRRRALGSRLPLR